MRLFKLIRSQRGGLSRGCMIGLIAVGGAIVLITVAIVLITVVFNEEIFRFVGTTMFQKSEQALIDAHPAGYSDADIRRILRYAQTALDSGRISHEEMGYLSERFQSIALDDSISSGRAREFLDVVIRVCDADTFRATSGDGLVQDSLTDAAADTLPTDSVR